MDSNLFEFFPSEDYVSSPEFSVLKHVCWSFRLVESIHSVIQEVFLGCYASGSSGEFISEQKIQKYSSPWIDVRVLSAWMGTGRKWKWKSSNVPSDPKSGEKHKQTP